ncbi:MAG: YCF48-related protein, partial [Caldilineales bacterium]|nr:YCF48-related protein [Caldilineales bacterium]
MNAHVRLPIGFLLACLGLLAACAPPPVTTPPPAQRLERPRGSPPIRDWETYRTGAQVFYWGETAIPPMQPGLQERQWQTNPEEEEEEREEEAARREREELYYFMLTYPGETFPLDARQKGYELLQRQMELMGQSAEAGWEPIGPAPIVGGNLGAYPIDSAGRTTALLIHPQNPDIVYAGGAQGGLWKTTNGGISWTPLTDGQASLAIGSLAFAPNNPNTLYVGTGEPHYSADSYYGAGLLRSTDGGATWTALGTTVFAGMGIADIVPHPSQANTLYVAASANVAGNKPLTANPGIWRSTDGGATWHLLVSACDSQGCVSPSALVMHPTNPDILYAGFDQIGIVSSTNGGINWTTLLSLTSPIRRAEVTLSRSNPSVLYAGLEVLTNQGGIGALFKSTNGGNNWTYLNTLSVSYCGQQCSYDNVLAVHPTNPNIFFAGGQALYSPNVSGIDGVVFWTTNGGASWSTNAGTSANTTLHPDLHAIAFAPSNPNIIWLGTDGGVFRSTDGGATWQQRNGNKGTLQFQSVALHPTDPNIVFGGMQDNAKAKTTNGGATWIGLDTGDGGFTAIDPFNPTYWYGTRFSIRGQVMQFQRNDANGSPSPNAWPILSNGINVNDRVLFYAPLAVDPNTAGRVYWGTHRLYRSNNRGNNWTAISGDLTKNIHPIYSAISAIGLLPGNANHILVGTADGNVQRTTDGGATWTNLTKAPLPNRFVTDVAIADAQTLYVAFSGFSANTPGAPGHVYKSTDGGQTWTDVSRTGQTNGLPDLPVLALALDRSAPGTVYIGTDLGVYRSTNGGNSWAPFNENFPRVAVFDLALQAYPNGARQLVAATHGRSMWRILLAQPAPTATPTPTTTRTPTITRTPTRTPTAT